MKTKGFFITLVVLGFLAQPALAKPNRLSDSEVKKAIIAESIAGWSGNCACPFNRARNGSACGKRSAWSKAGGYAPVCYENEVTPEMIREWRARRGEN